MYRAASTTTISVPTKPKNFFIAALVASPLSLDSEALQLLASLDLGSQPPGHTTPPRPGLGAVLGVAVLWRHRAPLQLARGTGRPAQPLASSGAGIAAEGSQLPPDITSLRGEQLLNLVSQLDELVESHR